MRRLMFVPLLAVAAAAAAVVISAQTITTSSPAAARGRSAPAANGRLQGGAYGVVKNAKGFPIEGLMVQLISQKTSIRTTVYTNQQGTYEFPVLDRGDYVLRLARPLEFRPYRKDSVHIDGRTALPEIVVEKVTESEYLPPTPDILPQLTGAEWLANMPGTQQEKDAVVGTCGSSCHSFQMQARARFSAADWSVE
jgi:hypothetical protein